jgi:hypothetical protein
VALDEPVVRLEAARVIERVRALGNHVPASPLEPRRAALPRLFQSSQPSGSLLPPDVTPPPVGAPRLLQWLDDWRVAGTAMADHLYYV